MGTPPEPPGISRPRHACRPAADRTRPRRDLRSHGLSLVEVLVVAGIVGVLVSMTLPAVQSAREAARRSQCCDRLRQIGLAAHSHQSAYRAFPYTSTNQRNRSASGPPHIPAIAPHRHLIAYLNPVVSQKMDMTDATFAVSGELPYSLSPKNAELLKVAIPSLLCPSDSGPVGGNNYRANLGPGPGIFAPDPHMPYSRRDPGNATGAFVHHRAVPVAEFLDGLSVTALFSEKIIGDGDRSIYSPLRDRFMSPVVFRRADDAVRCCHDYAVASPAQHDSYSGFTWLFGGWNHTWYNHVLTPNARTPDCSAGMLIGGGEGVYTARSFHPGGVNVLFADGACQFKSETIDLPVWRAMSTRRGKEHLDPR